MQYGVPYMGSKNSIASKIIALLPKAQNLYDLFGGGGAITHCALLSNKWGHVFYNDIEKGLAQLFADAVHGKYRNERRWITREDFNQLKDTDLYVRYCWSFGTSGTQYLYGKNVEPLKKAYWYAVMQDDYSLLRRLGFNVPKVSGKTYAEKRLALKAVLGECRSQSLERLERLQNLEALERLESRLSVSEKSYNEIEIRPNSLIYCDIPYENTAEYVAGSFNHRAFYDWASEQTELVVISSYDVSDDRFMRVINLKKRQQLSPNGRKSMGEGLFIAKDRLQDWKRVRGR